jgi:hypothetical protein
MNRGFLDHDHAHSADRSTPVVGHVSVRNGATPGQVRVVGAEDDSIAGRAAAQADRLEQLHRPRLAAPHVLTPARSLPSPLELLDVLRTNPAIGEFTDEPVPDDVLAELLVELLVAARRRPGVQPLTS